VFQCGLHTTRQGALLTKLRFTWVSAAAITTSLVAVSPAVAATVSVKNDRFTSSSSLRFKAGRGEANRARFDIEAKKVIVTDAGARLVAGHGCLFAGTHQVVCKTRLDSFDAYRVSLGDRADRADLRQRGGAERGSPDVAGGPGDDVIKAGGLTRFGFFSGGEGDDRITGTKDMDSISGGPGRDILIGGKGDDQFATDPSGATADDDLVRGGPGLDSVTYAGHTKPVSIDLRRKAPQGSAGERDVFHSVEGVTGTAGDDKLLGNAAENDLQGNRGRDVIEGFGGDDRVWGDGGKKDTQPDTISGGGGNDTVFADGGGTATGGSGNDEFQGTGTMDGGTGDDTFETTGGRVECGAGDDSVSIPNVKPPLLVGCETVALGKYKELSIDLPLERGESEIVAPNISCDQEDGETPDGVLCKNELKVTLGEQLLASGTFDASESNVSLHMSYQEGAKDTLGADPKQVRVTVGKYSFDSFL
jgi:serralysin